MKKCSIYIVLACAVVLSACSGLKGFWEKALSAEIANSQEQRGQQPNQGKIPKGGQSKQGDSQQGQPGESTSPNGGHPVPRGQRQAPVQPGKKEGEPPVTKEPEEQNALTPEMPEPNIDEFMPVETGGESPPAPELKLNPNFLAPEKFQHPLQTSNHLIFMLGQDDKGYYLYSEGAITNGAYDKFKRYVAHYERYGIKLDRLMMHSPGGMLAQGIQIGQFVRDNKWTTDLDKHMRCYSSCSMIYAAGVEKRMQAGAEVGFHRPYIPSEPDTPEFVNQVYQDYKSYWSSVQGDPVLYDDFMKNYGRDNMLVLTTETAPQHMKIEKY